MRRGRAIALAVSCAALAGSLPAAGPASAKTIEPHVYSGSFFGGDSTAGTFANPAFIAIDQTTQNLYVIDRGPGSEGINGSGTAGTFSQFSPAGVAIPFSDPALAGASSIPLGNLSGKTPSNNPGPDIAVDNSGTSSQGNIYVLKPPFEIRGYDPTGHPLPGPNWPICGASCGKYINWNDSALGLATDLDGTIWTGTSDYFTPLGNLSEASAAPPFELAPFDITGALSSAKDKVILAKREQTILGSNGPAYLVPGSTSFNPRHLDFDSEGNIYLLGSPLVAGQLPSGQNLMKLDPSGRLLNPRVSPLISTFDGVADNEPRQPDVAVDRKTDQVLLAIGESVRVYDSSGTQIDSIGLPTGSYPGLRGGVSPGVAVNSTTGKVYVSNQRDAQGTGVRTTGSPVITSFSTAAGFWPFMVGQQISGNSGIPGGTTIVDVTATTLTMSKNATSSGTTALFSRNPPSIDIFEPGAPMTVPDVATDPATSLTGTTATLNGTVNPDNGGAITSCFFEWGSTSEMTNTPVSCAGGLPSDGGVPVQVTAPMTGLSSSARYYYRLVVSNQPGGTQQQAGKVRRFGVASPPVLSNLAVGDVNTDTAEVKFHLDPKGDITNYRIQVGLTDSYGIEFRGGLKFSAGSPVLARDVIAHLDDLNPDTTYHYRVVAENEAGTTFGPDRTFTTFAFVPDIKDPCPNSLTRQQTGAALLLDCRAYELVSAADQGGYNVQSDLAPEQSPFPGYPLADDKVLYAVHNGGIPGTGNPTNRGPDPYVASRGSDGWETKYVGIPSNGPPSLLPFSSTLVGADADLSTFAFGGPEICAPCFEDGSTGMPLRLRDGSLVQGIHGAVSAADPVASGFVAKHFSADGSHFVFGTTSQIELDGNSGEISLYDRNLDTGITQVVSKTPAGDTITGAELGVLDVSVDGSRILFGELVSTDSAGNQYWHPYMHVGSSPNTIDLAPGTTSGVLFAGMNSAGTKVSFTTPDKLLGDDTDDSADLYGADVDISSATLSRVSTGIEGTGDTNACDPVSNLDGNNWNAVGGASTNGCGVVGIAGGGGVSSGDGTVFFLSPEKLDGTSGGTQNQPNLYIAEAGSDPHYVATLEPGNPAIRHAVADAEVPNTADFQVNPSGDDAAFTTTLSLSGYENRGFSQVFHYDSTGQVLTCISCPRSEAPSTGDAGLAFRGLSVTDDGRLFFNSTDRMVLRDANKSLDVYEWTPAGGGTVELISTGAGAQDSSLLSASADGADVFFFTRQRLVSQDLNGPIVKVYDAREEGGFFVIAPQQPCKASDECHGPSSAAAVPPPVRTIAGTQGQTGPQKPTGPKKCRKPLVKRRGKCVRKSQARSKKQARSKRNSTRRDG